MGLNHILHHLVDTAINYKTFILFLLASHQLIHPQCFGITRSTFFSFLIT